MRTWNSFIKTSKIRLYNILKNLGLQKPKVFDQLHLPDKYWMLDLMQMIKSDHQIFKTTLNDVVVELS
ncbi:hypothetical protein pb186bvf_004844 [Paramecium bursaria]